MDFDDAEDLTYYEQYQRRYGEPSRRLALEIALAKAPPDTTRILVVGCGLGPDIVHLARRCPEARIVATESSAAMLRSAEQLVAGFGERITLIHADADTIPLEVGRFELIISHGSMRRWGDQAAGLAHIHRLLSPGGLIYISDVHGDIPADLVGELAERMAEERDRQFFREQVAMAPTIERLRELLARAGIREYELAVGGLGGHGRHSPEAGALVQNHEHVRAILMELFQGGGYGHPRSSEAVLHLYIRASAHA